jgi:hypothetical protein
MPDEEKFDPKEMEKIILRLESQDRLPGEQEFLRNVGKVRTKYRPKILEERNASSEK